MSEEAGERAIQEMAYCETILAKTSSSVLLKILPSKDLITFKHYPEKDVYDPVSGAQWYYHCHDNSEEEGEHGHFHCFVRPDGRDSAPCHLIAVGVDSRGKPTRLFTVNQWVVGGPWFDADTTNSFLDRFNVELAEPDFLVNRWLTAMITRYEKEIIQLNVERDRYLTSLQDDLAVIHEDRNINILTVLEL